MNTTYQYGRCCLSGSSGLAITSSAWDLQPRTPSHAALAAHLKPRRCVRLRAEIKRRAECSRRSGEVCRMMGCSDH
jgi:hypothetical protein